MAPYDKDAKVVAEQVEKVEPVNEPETVKTPEHLELENLMGMKLRFDQLPFAREVLRAQMRCDCTGSRYDLMRAAPPPPPPPPPYPGS